MDNKVLYIDVINHVFRQPVKIECSSSTCTHHIIDINIFKCWRRFIHRWNLFYDLGFIAIFQGFHHRFATIIEVEVKRLSSDIKHTNMTNKNILHYAPTTSTAFKPQPNICTQELTIRHKNVFNTARHLTTDDKTTVPFKYGTIADNDVFSREITLPTILIFAGFYTDPIITHIKGAIDDNRIFTGFQIQSIAILCIGWVPHLHAIQDHIFAHQWVDVPSR